MKPTVSIIIPCYNQAKYIGETIESVLAQTFQDWECIVMNDGSSDDSERIILPYCEKDQRIHYYKQENAGVCRARNQAIKHAQGEFLLPLDGDDLIAPQYIELAVNYMREHPQTRLVYCLAERFGDINGPWLLPNYRYEWLVVENMIFNTSLFRKADFERVGGYNENMRTGFEDWDFFLKLIGPDDKVHRIEKVLFYYRSMFGTRTDNATETEKELQWQIMMNHPEIYKEWILRYRRKHREHAANLACDEATKWGKKITKVLRKIREWKRLKKYKG
jgi:glycosyltransferase involved in cell wall biosynthesis